MIEGSDLEMFERSLREVTRRHTGEALDEALAELGWPDALAADRRTAISSLFPLQGAANASSSALDLVVAAGLGGGDIEAVAAVLPALGVLTPPGDLTSERLRIQGLATPSITRSDTALVVARSGQPQAITVVTVATADLAMRKVEGIDPAFGLVEVAGEGVAYQPGGRPAPGAWDQTVVMAQLAIAHEILGAARAMLDLARDHATERVQFGQPIAKFQAIRHRLADTVVAIEAAEAVVIAAWEDLSPELAACAKALAGRGSRTAARHCQQVLAGIGFTAEHPFHRYFRRIIVLDQLFGSSRALTEAFGRRLLATRQLPDLVSL